MWQCVEVIPFSTKLVITINTGSCAVTLSRWPVMMSLFNVFCFRSAERLLANENEFHFGDDVFVAL